MSDQNLCDNCKREPKAFTTDTGDKAYWLRVPKENQDPSHLITSLEFAFIAMVPEFEDQKAHPIDDKDNDYWCADCAGSAYPDNEVLP